MIATVTLNPSLDRHVAVENLVLDDTNRWVSFKSEPGGKGINVSRVICELGGRAVAYGFMGGEDGRSLKNILKQKADSSTPTIALLLAHVCIPMFVQW